LYLFAVCRPSTDKAFALALPRLNADAMNVGLVPFSRQLGAGVHAVLVPNHAGWHDERDLHVPENIALLPLPAVASKSNPLERVWLYPRERSF
jgi:hypothetical protein